MDNTLTARAHQKFIDIMLINQLEDTKMILRGQNIGSIQKMDGQRPSNAEANKILYQLRAEKQEVNKVGMGSLDDFIINGDQVQLKRPVQYAASPKISLASRKELDNIIEKYKDIFSKNQYDVGTSTHPPVEIPTKGPPCISAPYTIPLKFRPWASLPVC